MEVILTMTAVDRRILWRHLLQNETEQVAFVFAALTCDEATTEFVTADMYLATPEDFEYQGSYHVTLNDAARARMIKQAWDTNTALVEFHSHPKENCHAYFSPSDLVGLAEFVPHCWWRLQNRPYAAILVTPKTFDALVWVTQPKMPTTLDAIVLDSRQRLAPTNRTISLLHRRRTSPYGQRTI